MRCVSYVFEFVLEEYFGVSDQPFFLRQIFYLSATENLSQVLFIYLQIFTQDMNISNIYTR